MANQSVTLESIEVLLDIVERDPESVDRSSASANPWSRNPSSTRKPGSDAKGTGQGY